MIEISEAQLERVEKVLIKALESQPAASQNSNTAKIYINANGIGIFILLFVASFVLGVATFSSFSTSSRMSTIERKQDRQDDYLQAIYSIAPQLKPKETK